MPQGFEAARVSAARLLSPRIRNITIAAESLAAFAFEPGADVAIRSPGGEGIADERHYSVGKGTAEGRVDLCVALHGLGPGGRRGAARGGGGMVEVAPSRALPIALDRSVEAHLFLGDETSIASAEALTRALPPETLVLACFEVASMDHRWPDSELGRPEKVRWVARAGRPGSALLSWLAGQSLSSTNSTTAYVTGRGVALRDGTRASRARPWLSHGRCPYQAVLENQV